MASQANGCRKQAGVAILLSDKRDFEPKLLEEIWKDTTSSLKEILYLRTKTVYPSS